MNVKQFNVCLLFAALAQQTLFAAAYANPAGATVVNGQVSFSQPDVATLQITNSPGAIVNWQDFNIGAQEITRFVQESGSSAILNRVTGGNISDIQGQLQSNGKVFLINPNGLLIGQDAVIDTAGFLGSTLNITDQDFLNGRMHFEGENAADIDSRGYIRVGNGGDILLIAPNITNSGVLEVNGGNILLAAGQSIAITSLDNANISFEVQAAEDSVTNLGQLIANNGAANIFAGTLTHTGSVSANGITTDAAGNIRLVAKDTNWVEGDVNATGKQGGNIQLLGEQVGLAGNAVIDASGTNGGGEILIGGDYQGQGDVQTARASYVGENVRIKADALENGDGGKVIVWGDESTRMYGDISARGGALSGDGGFIETSGGFLDIGVNVPDVSAPMGQGGTWLIDPYDIIITTGFVSPNMDVEIAPFTSIGSPASIGIGLINSALVNGNVLVQTGNDAQSTGAGNILWEAGANLDLFGIGNGKTLRLLAHNDIFIDGQVFNSATSAATESINLIIDADSDGDGAGGFTLGSTGNLTLGFGSGVGSLTVNASTDILLDGIIDTNGGSVNLNTNGGTVAQSSTSAMAANSLVATSFGNMEFLGSNSVSDLNAKLSGGSNLTFNNTGALSISEINAIGGTVKVNNTGDITQGAGGLVAGSLDIVNTGNVTLINTANDVDAITASTSTSGGTSLLFSFTDLDGLEIQDINVSNQSTSLASSFLDITTGGDMTLNGNINSSGGATGSGISLNAQNGSSIIYQSGVLTSDNVNFQNDASPTTTGAVGSSASPVQVAGQSGFIDINLGQIGSSGLAESGGDLFILNTAGNLSLIDYLPTNPSALQIENTAGDIDLQNLFMLDSLGSPTELLTSTSIFLKASGNLIFPLSTGTPMTSTLGDIFVEGQNLTIDQAVSSAGDITLVSSLGALNINNDVATVVGGLLSLNSSGDILQGSSGGAIVAGTLDIVSAGNVTMNNAANDVDVITASSTTGSGTSLLISFTDLDDLEVQNINISNQSATPSQSFLDITTGGDMTLNGIINASGDANGSGISLNAQNGSSIIYQGGVLTSDNVNFQNDGLSTTIGAVGSAANPVEVAALGNFIAINHGNSGSSASGGDLFILDTAGNLSLNNYTPQVPSFLEIQNLFGDINLSSLNTTELVAASISLRASGGLLLPLTESGQTASLISTTGGIFLQGLSINTGVLSAAGDIELIANDFSINGAVTAQNQVIIREFSLGGLEVNDDTANTTLATLTTADLSLLTGTTDGILLSNSAGSKIIQILSDINSSMINGPRLTIGTTDTGTAKINANIDFTGENENLLFSGNGFAEIGPGAVPSDILIDTGTGNFGSTVSQLDISGTAGSQVVVRTNNAGITGDLFVSSGNLAGSSALFTGNNLTLQGSLGIFADGANATVEFTNLVDINSPSFVDLSGGNLAGANARLLGGDINISASSVALSGGQAVNASAELLATGNIGISATGKDETDTFSVGIRGGDALNASASIRAGGNIGINAADNIIMLVGTAPDTDAYISAGNGLGTVVLNYVNCLGCASRIILNPEGNGVRDNGIRALTISRNGNVSGFRTLDPIRSLSGLFQRFVAARLNRMIEERKHRRKLLICT